MKRWGLRVSSMSAVTKVRAGQNASHIHLTPNVLYTMLAFRALFIIIKPRVGKASSLTGFGCALPCATRQCA